ncbi:MAG: AMP-binding protein, partial [Planctomycetota bacterium]
VHGLVRGARRAPWKRRVVEPGRKPMSRLAVLAGAVALARRLRRELDGQPCLAVLLPPSLGAVLANLAGALAGRTLVNLNYSIGEAAMASSLQQCGATKVVTARRFLDRCPVGLPADVTPILLEDVLHGIGPGARAAALALALLAPVALLQRACGAARASRPDDLATVLFSSGSTGEPKGVMLSHENLAANIDSAIRALALDRDHKILANLPFFHSFGTLILWLGATGGVPLVLQANPLDAAEVGRLVAEHRLTVLVTTPTFLQLYVKRCTPAQLASLRLVVTGAEKLPPWLAERFEERFGKEILEGYGTTECAPVVSVNLPGANRPGSVGRPIPDVRLRVVDPDDGRECATGERGMVLVSGPNVMQGYLGRDDKTAEVLSGGWYRTGDLGFVDADGFLHITDRESRFSKIGGEMVPHGVVEEAIHRALGAEDRVAAVTAVPDPRKGERLVVLHTFPEERVDDVFAALTTAGLPNLFLPRRDAFVRVDELPLLGSGKVDLRRVREIARSSVEDPMARGTTGRAGGC